VGIAFWAAGVEKILYKFQLFSAVLSKVEKLFKCMGFWGFGVKSQASDLLTITFF